MFAENKKSSKKKSLEKRNQKNVQENSQAKILHNKHTHLQYLPQTSFESNLRPSPNISDQSRFLYIFPTLLEVK